MRAFLMVFMLLGLIACGKRGEITFLSQLPPEKAVLAENSTELPIYIATSRLPEPDGDFGFQRAPKAHFLRYDVLLPQNHEAGRVVWPRNAKMANPETDFLTKARVDYPDSDAFSQDLRQALRKSRQEEVVIYVHGFNNTLAESTYRVAQMHHDLKMPGVAVHYAWPSRGSPLGYVYDRDSALFGRDALETLIEEAVDGGAKRVILVAHSMGAALTMETLRQVAIRNNQKVRNAIKGVILISPDLDVDLFRSQALAFDQLPQPFVIFGSRKDLVLMVSSRLAGMPDRLGNLKDATPLEGLEVAYYDTAEYNAGTGHNNFGESPALLQLLSGISNVDAAFRAEAASRVGLLPGVVLTLRKATTVALSPLEKATTAD